MLLPVIMITAIATARMLAGLRHHVHSNRKKVLVRWNTYMLGSLQELLSSVALYQNHVECNQTMSIRLTKETAGNCALQDIELDRVVAHMRPHSSAVIAFSGGADSSVVAALAKRAFGEATVAVTVDNGALHHGEVEHAAAIADEIGIRHVVITVNPLNIYEVKQNDPERCYFCKKLVFGALRDLAEELHFTAVMDGTNASDLNGYRPGLKALRELGVVSPLLDLTKDEVRSLARRLGLSNADAPSVACLLTSFPYGTIMTGERIERLRDAERALKAIGIAQVKIRDHDHFARIEVDREEAGKVLTHSSAITNKLLEFGFTYGTLDLQWLRSGSMDIALCSARKESANDC
jgi:pyridinium-3,5-biscarboxylic acid mononucleotide sulfurtransferase